MGGECWRGTEVCRGNMGGRRGWAQGRRRVQCAAGAHEGAGGRCAVSIAAGGQGARGVASRRCWEGDDGIDKQAMQLSGREGGRGRKRGRTWEWGRRGVYKRGARAPA